jgi:phospholipase/carboxylesterase
MVVAPRRAADGRLETRFPAESPVAALPPGVHPLDLGAGVEALLAVPPGEPAPRPLLVFFHGAGGSAHHALALARDRAAERGVLLLATTSLAATWDLLAGNLGRDVAVLDAALSEVAAGARVGRVAVGGFSDGASYALSLGIANGDLFDAVLAFSPGFAAPPDRVASPRIWITHGARDRVLPVDRCGRRVSGQLAAAGHAVTYEEFDGEHVVPPDRLAAGLDWWLGPA